MSSVFVIATIICVVGIAFIYKMMLGKVIASPHLISHHMTRYFMGVGLVEMIPIVLLVIGLTKSHRFVGMDEIVVPVILVILFWAAGLFFVFLQRKFSLGAGANKDQKDVVPAIQQLTLITIALMTAIPLVSVICLLMMVI